MIDSDQTDDEKLADLGVVDILSTNEPKAEETKNEPIVITKTTKHVLQQ